MLSSVMSIQTKEKFEKKATQKSEKKILCVSRIFLVSLSSISLSAGSAIYILFRDESLRVFSWLHMLGIYDATKYFRLKISHKIVNIPDYFLYSFPDFLWSLSFTLSLHAIWWNSSSKIKNIWISLPCSIGVASEIGQYFNIISGTFDKFDTFSYLFSYIVSIILVHFLGKKLEKHN